MLPGASCPSGDHDQGGGASSPQPSSAPPALVLSVDVGKELYLWASVGPSVKHGVLIGALGCLWLFWDGILGVRARRSSPPPPRLRFNLQAHLQPSLPLSPLLEVQWLKPGQQVGGTGAHSLWADQPWTLHLSNQAVLCGFLPGSAPCPQPGLWPQASPRAPPERFWEDIGGFLS